MVHTYQLPQLAYGLQDLEPAISGQIMDLHYNKHHQTYVTNLNNALQQHSQALGDGNVIKHLELQRAINFNAGGHVNHTLFWENLTPQSTSNVQDAPTLQEALEKRWKDFKAEFEAVALALQGSGWVWLVKSRSNRGLEIVTSKDQDLAPGGSVPVIGVDMWEHAYYLQYFNNKKSYVQSIWAVINWKTAEKRFRSSPKEVYGDLIGLTGNI